MAPLMEIVGYALVNMKRTSLNKSPSDLSVTYLYPLETVTLWYRMEHKDSHVVNLTHMIFYPGFSYTEDHTESGAPPCPPLQQGVLCVHYEADRVPARLRVPLG